MHKALTIAGSDPSGGAGIQVDLKVFNLHKVYGLSAITAITIQNTQGISQIYPVTSEHLLQQIEFLLEDTEVNAIKSGILWRKGHIEAVTQILRKYRIEYYILDPIIKSSSGYTILDDIDIDLLKKELLPLSLIVTPNLMEAESLSGRRVKDLEEMRDAAKAIYYMGARHVLIKGGHLKGTPVDLLYDGQSFEIFKGERIDKHLHGTGCVYSAAIAANIAKGIIVAEAIGTAKRFVEKAIKNAEPLGKGRLPLKFFPS